MSRTPSRKRALLAAVAMMACEASVPRSSRSQASPEAPQEADRFRPDALEGSASAEVRDARLALARGDHAAALSVAESALPGADVVTAPRLRYLAGRAALAANETARGRAHLAAVAELAGHPLAPYARLALARSLEPEDATAARAALEPIEALDFAARSETARLLARLRLASGEVALGLDRLLAIAETSSGEPLAEVAGPALDALVARDDVASYERALALLHRVYAKAPRTSLGRSAEARLRDVGRRLLDGGVSGAEPTLDERIERAEGLASARVEDALAAYDDVLSRLPADDARACALRFGRAKALERGRDKRRAAEALVQVAEACDDPEIRGYGFFKAGKALAAVDDDDAAIETYGRLVREAQSSRFADDGAVALARMHLRRGEADLARAALQAAVELPAGDLRAEAFFLLGYDARERGDHEAALGHFRVAHETAPESGEENVGRNAYWEARTLATLGRDAEAADAYHALAHDAALTYYGVSALARLTELAPARAEALRAELAPEPSPVELALDRRIDRAGFSRAAELLHVGELAYARVELTTLGLVGDGAREDGLFVAASLYAATEHPNEAVELLRRRIAGLRVERLSPDTRAKLRVAYPRAFATLVERAAADAAVPPTFVRAIAREESSFDPAVVSRANAVGLIQILPSTARGFAREVGVEPTADNLKQAELNLAFGTRFMGRLFRRFEANPGLVPAAYNAGHGAVERWLRAEQASAFDEFVEEIPYEETRRYTRRVLQSYAVYEYLDEGRLPTLPLALR